MPVPRLWLPNPYGRAGHYTDTLSAVWATGFVPYGGWNVYRQRELYRATFWDEAEAQAFIEAEIERLGE